MRTIDSPLPGVLLLETRVFGDSRGYFRETWRAEEYAAAGLPERFVQDNASFSTHGILRGLHLQEGPHAQGKLVSALYGEIWDVAVDVRAGSEEYGRWAGVALSGENGRQLYIPPGFAHGFVVTSAQAVVAYKCTELYVPESERTIRWDDPQLGIEWPVAAPVVSEKDRAGMLLSELRRG